MTDERDPADREKWGSAKSLGELGELMALWTEGVLRYRPGYYGREPDPETEPLREMLAAYNRNGFVTIGSQPGMTIDDRGTGQRAWVEGYATEDVARSLGALGLWTDLLVFLFPSRNYDYERGYQVPITVVEFHPFTWAGARLGYEELEHFAEDCPRDALEALLRRAWEVVIIDPRWGREAYLWEHVSRVLLEKYSGTDKLFSVTPAHPDLGTDFVY